MLTVQIIWKCAMEQHSLIVEQIEVGKLFIEQIVNFFEN